MLPVPVSVSSQSPVGEERPGPSWNESDAATDANDRRLSQVSSEATEDGGIWAKSLSLTQKQDPTF